MVCHQLVFVHIIVTAPIIHTFSHNVDVMLNNAAQRVRRSLQCVRIVDIDIRHERRLALITQFHDHAMRIVVVRTLTTCISLIRNAYGTLRTHQQCIAHNDSDPGLLFERQQHRIPRHHIEVP